MIVKELDPFAPDDVLARAGRAAEEQMAFYLRRAFAGDEDILVLNSVRLERDGDAAQIDHLVLHRYGAVVVESKSVTGTIRVNARGEWSPVYGRDVRGMPSPLLQAERQFDFLWDYLLAHGDRTPDKDLLVQVRVAISDGGVIERPRGVNLDQVLKADQVPGAIRSIIRATSALEGNQSVLARMPNKVAGVDADSKLSQQDLSRYAEFLLEHHRPLEPKAGSAAAPRPPAAPKPPASMPARPSAPAPRVEVRARAPAAPVCRHCGSRDLSVAYGHNYYYKCRSCRGNTPIDPSRARCGGAGRVRKNGRRFFLDCPRCRTSTLFHTV